jgi:hypothetical protein
MILIVVEDGGLPVQRRHNKPHSLRSKMSLPPTGPPPGAGPSWADFLPPPPQEQPPPLGMNDNGRPDTPASARLLQQQV